MKKLLAIIGCIAIIIFIFMLGYGIGTTPTIEEEQAKIHEDKVIEDITTLGDKYSDLYDLCESKYQLVIEGDWSSAYSLKGQQDLLLEQINEILDKYDGDYKIKPL